jgi:glycosyltransferase involved in cell wall biosynthesis
MRIAVVAAGTLRGTGYANRIASMVRSYASAGHEVDLFHLVFPGEDALPDETRRVLGSYRVIGTDAPGRLDHLRLLPRHVRSSREAAARAGLDRQGRYDVVQSENSNVWPLAQALPTRRRVAIFHDDDAARWRRYASMPVDPVRRAVRLATARKYGAWQRRVMREADETWFVSAVEMRRYLGQGTRVRLVPNGAERRFFENGTPASGTEQVVMFVGPMSYDVNVAGVSWFLDVVWPRIRAVVPAARFEVVGRGWTDHLPGDLPGVIARGFVPDLPVALGQARVSVAPLPAGGGTKIKVLESMAAARPVVTTSVGAEGVPSARGLAVADDEAGFASKVIRWLVDAGDAGAAGAANRRAVQDLAWPEIWSRALEHLEELASSKSPVPVGSGEEPG